MVQPMNDMQKGSSFIVVLVRVVMIVMITCVDLCRRYRENSWRDVCWYEETSSEMARCLRTWWLICAMEIVGKPVEKARSLSHERKWSFMRTFGLKHSTEQEIRYRVRWFVGSKANIGYSPTKLSILVVNSMSYGLLKLSL